MDSKINIDYRKNFAGKKFWLLGVACLAFFIAIGCAQNKVNQSDAAPLKPRTSGLSDAGKFRALTIADVDNDGHLDIIGGVSSPGAVTISYGDGRGGISEPQYLPVKGDVRAVAVADFNEDGRPDIIYSVQMESAGIRLWKNMSKRQWIVADGPIEINKYEGLQTADVNNDGHLDIIAANATSDTKGGIQIWLGDGKGNWPAMSGPTITGRFMDVALADFNHDGHLDVIGAGWGPFGALRLWHGDGSGNWSPMPPLARGSFYGLSIDDLNQDGYLDILAGSFRADVQIFLGNMAGEFEKSISPSIYVKRQMQKHAGDEKISEDIHIPKGDESYWDVLAVDLDGDGMNDIVASSLESHGIQAWKNMGKKGWSVYKGSFPNNGKYYSLAAGDLNNDNWLDICAAGFGEGIKIWPGRKEAFRIAGNRQLDRAGNRRIETEFLAPKENDIFVTVAGTPEYKIDAGDVLEITLWQGITPQKHEIKVRPDGKISFGFVEDLSVSGLTTAQLDDRLTKFMAQYVKRPRIDVLVKEHKSKSIMLVGAINSLGISGSGPGRYYLNGKATVLEMITKASGPAANANLTSVRVRRKNGESISLNLYKTLLQGDASHDLIVDDGDVVFVPTLSKEGSRVYVFGEVEQPGAYTFSGTNTNLLDAISEAGGPTVFAATADTKIARGDPLRPEIITADLGSLMAEGNYSQNLSLANGDMIYVPRSGWGNINLVNQRIRPLMEMILWPARTIIDWYRASDIISSGGSN